MPQGLETYNADGSAQISFGDRVFRSLQAIGITGAGSITVDSQGGTLRGFVPGTMAPGAKTEERVVTVSGNTVSWTAGRGSVIYILAF